MNMLLDSRLKHLHTMKINKKTHTAMRASSTLTIDQKTPFLTSTKSSMFTLDALPISSKIEAMLVKLGPMLEICTKSTKIVSPIRISDYEYGVLTVIGIVYTFHHRFQIHIEILTYTKNSPKQKQYPTVIP